MPRSVPEVVDVARERIRGDVVEALVKAHGETGGWLVLAAVEFEIQPPPTAAEKDEARATVLRGSSSPGIGSPCV